MGEEEALYSCILWEKSVLCVEYKRTCVIKHSGARRWCPLAWNHLDSLKHLHFASFFDLSEIIWVAPCHHANWRVPLKMSADRHMCSACGPSWPDESQLWSLSCICGISTSLCLNQRILLRGRAICSGITHLQHYTLLSHTWILAVPARGARGHLYKPGIN